MNSSSKKIPPIYNNLDPIFCRNNLNMKIGFQKNKPIQAQIFDHKSQNYLIQNNSYSIQQKSLPKFKLNEQIKTQHPIRQQLINNPRCKFCHHDLNIIQQKRNGNTTWGLCVVFSLFGCCFLPFLLDKYKDVYQTCQRCRRILKIKPAEL